MKIDTLRDLLIQSGALALLALVLVYGVRVALPRVLDQFTKSLQVQRDDFRAALVREREVFERLLKIEHDRWLETMERMSKAIDRLAGKVEGDNELRPRQTR